MGKLQKNQSGFSAVEIMIVLVIVALIGVVGFMVNKNRDKITTASVATTAATKPTKSAASVPIDPYAGWKTYNSILESGLSFKYPADWSFTPPTQVFTNNGGGQENNVTLYSVAPQTKPGVGSPVPTNQYMCVTFDEYGGAWQSRDWKLGTLLNSEKFQSGGTSVMLNTYKGETPMQDQMVLITNPSNSNGNHYISTQNNYYVGVTSEFNCQQGGFPAGANLNADFNSQPETATAKLIMKSIQL